MASRPTGPSGRGPSAPLATAEPSLACITDLLYVVGVPAFAALADDTRVQIVEALASDDRSVSELVGLFPISQPAISRHLRLLREAGVVSVRPEGKQRIYRLNPSSLGEV